MFLTDRQFEVMAYLARSKRARIKVSGYSPYHVTYWLSFGPANSDGGQVDGRTVRALRRRQLVAPTKDALGEVDDRLAMTARGRNLFELERVVRSEDMGLKVEEEAA